MKRFNIKQNDKNNLRKENALSHKLYYIDSKILSETTKVYKIMGSTGNVYDVILDAKPSCTCPDCKYRGMKCKHIYFVLIKILKLTDDKNSFTNEELNVLIKKKDITDGIKVDNSILIKYKKCVDGSIEQIPIKPKTDDICPICMDDIINGEAYEYCQWSCGNSVHNDCFNIWKTKQGNDDCIICKANFYKKPTISNDGEYFNLLIK